MQKERPPTVGTVETMAELLQLYLPRHVRRQIVESQRVVALEGRVVGESVEAAERRLTVEHVGAGTRPLDG